VARKLGEWHPDPVPETSWQRPADQFLYRPVYLGIAGFLWGIDGCLDVPVHLAGMSLLDDLRLAASAVDPQFLPAANEVLGVVGALVHYVEHGDSFLKAAEQGVDEVVKLLAPPAPEPPPAPAAPPAAAAAPAPAAPATDAELEAQIADLQAQLATRQATAQQSTVTHEPGAPPS
jgi:hypothetical protein